MEKIGFTGLTNKIIVKNNKIIKESLPISQRYLKRENEIYFYQQLKHIKLNNFLIPDRYKLNKTKNTFISSIKVLENSHDLTSQKLTKKHINKIFGLIETLHSLAIELVDFNPGEFLTFFQTNIKIDPLVEFDSILETVNYIVNHYYDDQVDLIPSHNDLNRGNFLWAHRKAYLIDFEYVSYNHYLFDYASFLSESLINDPKMTKYFLKQLNLNDQEHIKLNQLIIYQNVLWIYWAQYMYENTDDNQYLTIIIEKKMQLLNKSKS